jgi:hypothetical protein
LRSEDLNDAIQPAQATGSSRYTNNGLMTGSSCERYGRNFFGEQMLALSSASCGVSLAILRPDPGDDFPDVILGRDDLTIGGHRPNNILGAFAHEALLLEGVPWAETSGAECDQAEQGVIIAAIDPNLVGERCCHSSTATTAMTPAAVVRAINISALLGNTCKVRVRTF